MTLNSESYREEMIGIKSHLEEIYDECVNQQVQLHAQMIKKINNFSVQLRNNLDSNYNIMINSISELENDIDDLESFKLKTSNTMNLFSQLYRDQTLSALGQPLQSSSSSSSSTTASSTTKSLSQSEKKSEDNVDRKYYSSRGDQDNVSINDKD